MCELYIQHHRSNGHEFVATFDSPAEAEDIIYWFADFYTEEAGLSSFVMDFEFYLVRDGITYQAESDGPGTDTFSWSSNW
jgi:hypothetical protein